MFSNFLCWSLPSPADGLIERRLLVLEERSRRGAPAPEGAGLLTALLTSKTLPREEVYTTVTELLLGGVDTVRGGRPTE